MGIEAGGSKGWTPASLDVVTGMGRKLISIALVPRYAITVWYFDAKERAAAKDKYQLGICFLFPHVLLVPCALLASSHPYASSEFFVVGGGGDAWDRTHAWSLSYTPRPLISVLKVPPLILPHPSLALLPSNPSMCLISF